VAAPIEISADAKRMLGMPPARFLRDYWQKRPLLIRGAFAPFENPVAPNDLAGLACEELALARIVIEESAAHSPPMSFPRSASSTAKLVKRESMFDDLSIGNRLASPQSDSRFRGNDVEKSGKDVWKKGKDVDGRTKDFDRRIDTPAPASLWTLRNGPFAESDFATLPKTHWTLLVQDVDKWDADVAALLQPFDFLPSWRVDDVMISYAEDGGSVGAHVDQYDVFLLQGLGRRRWQISIDPEAPKTFRDDTELRLLREFAPTHEWVLEPGDMLYLPPGVPHHGVALGACMTYSIGMRAPSQAELLVDFAETLAESVLETSRLTDPDLLPSRGDGEIDDAAIARVMGAMPWFGWGHQAAAASSSRRTPEPSSLLRNRSGAKSLRQERVGHVDGCSGELDSLLLRTWFGRFITRYRSAHAAAPHPHPPGGAAFARAIEQGARARRNPWSRCAWMRQGRDAMLFVAGDAHACSVRLARLVAAQPDFELAAAPATARDRAVLRDLVAAGHLALMRAPKKRSGA
jgi:50S ribosomal protein L16 3-hydroxylase